MARIKESISGKVISPQKIEISDSERSKLIPGQKVLIYKTTGHNIVSASGKIIGEKEKVLGSGKERIDGDKLIVERAKTTSTTPTFYAKEIVSGRNISKSKAANQSVHAKKFISDCNVLIKPIDE